MVQRQECRGGATDSYLDVAAGLAVFRNDIYLVILVADSTRQISQHNRGDRRHCFEYNESVFMRLDLDIRQPKDAPQVYLLPFSRKRSM